MRRVVRFRHHPKNPSTLYGFRRARLEQAYRMPLRRVPRIVGTAVPARCPAARLLIRPSLLWCPHLPASWAAALFSPTDRRVSVALGTWCQQATVISDQYGMYDTFVREEKETSETR